MRCVVENKTLPSSSIIQHILNHVNQFRNITLIKGIIDSLYANINRIANAFHFFSVLEHSNEKVQEQMHGLLLHVFATAFPLWVSENHWRYNSDSTAKQVYICIFMNNNSIQWLPNFKFKCTVHVPFHFQDLSVWFSLMDFAFAF